MLPDLAFHTSLALTTGAVLALLRVTRSKYVFGPAALAFAVAAGAFSLGFAKRCDRSLFGAIAFASWALFLHAPVFLVLVAGLWRHQRRLAQFALTLAALIVLVGIDAFWNEPTWLEVTHTRIPCAGLDEPLTVALLADIQTDRIGAYEERVMKRVMQERPDLILFAGDYIQHDGRAAHQLGSRDARLTLRRAERRRLRELFERVGLAAPLGIFAVGGNTDGRGWETCFEGLDAHVFIESGRVLARDAQGRARVLISGLDPSDSSRVNARVDRAAPEEKPAGSRSPGPLHIALGHYPNFARGRVDADLLVAGHCHGGQVCLPFYGPPLTLAPIARSWTSGATHLEPLEAGPADRARPRTLYVSRGIGMERGWAPRLRFLCRPELAILELVPAER